MKHKVEVIDRETGEVVVEAFTTEFPLSLSGAIRDGFSEAMFMVREVAA